MSRLNRLNTSGTTTARIFIGSSGGSGTLAGQSNTEYCQRGLVAFPSDVIAMRLRTRNIRQNRAPVAISGALNITGFWMGQPLLETPVYWGYSGAPPWFGRFKAPPSLVFPSFATDAGGAEYVSSWVTDRSVLPRGGRTYAWSFGCKAQASSAQPVGECSIGGVLWGLGGGTQTGLSLAANAGAAGRPLGTGPADSGIQILDTRLEVVMASMPVMFAIGDSITHGVIDTPTTVPPRGGCYNFESWPGRAGQLQRVAVSNLGIGGNAAGTNGFGPADPTTSWLYQRADWTTSPPDAVALALATNDLADGLSTMQTNIMACIDNIRTLAPRTKVLLCTLVPKSLAATAANEITRQSYNLWVRSMPYGVHHVIDLDTAVNPAGTPPSAGNVVLGDPNLMGIGTPHPLMGGYNVMAQRVPLIGSLN